MATGRNRDQLDGEDEQLRDEAQEAGQGMVEYAFIIVLIALVLILLVTVIGHQTTNFYSNISNGFVGH